MEETDVQLIQRILSGDGEAFTVLVRKHQKSVHALAWRRVGDFHLAEELTQDTFLRVYKKLPTLKDPNHFSGWLYVVTTRICNSWLQKNKPVEKDKFVKSLEDLPVGEIERSSYARYLTDQREEDARAHRYELVNKLLDKLPESERTVVTLYYLGEMTVKEIGKFLGVSVNTITSRLQRARKRLQQDEELLVQEMLGSVRLSDSLTENIARKASDIEMTPPPVGKPFLPWVAFGATAVLVTLVLMGMANQYLTRFQKPYSFKAQSEPTVEIIDAPVVLNTDAKPAVRSQTGRAVTTNESSGTGAQVPELDSTSSTSMDPLRFAASRWTQATGPGGGPVSDIFATAGGTLYAFSQAGIYRLTSNAPAWTLVNSRVPIEGSRMLVAEHRDALYIVSKDKVFASTDNGETWNAFSNRPKGDAVGFVITDNAEQTGIAMYLALQREGVFRSADGGKGWAPLDDGLTGRTISAVAAIKDVVFVGTDRGLYRLNSGEWEQLPVDRSRTVQALAVSEGNLYVGTGSGILALKQPESEASNSGRVMGVRNSDSNRIFRSTNLGGSWLEITPTNGPGFLGTPVGIRLLAVGETLLALGVNRFRSEDGGQTWTDLGFDDDLLMLNSSSTVVANKNTFYDVGEFGIHRTTDTGESWHPFMDGMVGSGILDLIALNGRLYAHVKGDIDQSTDGGESWKTVPVDLSEGTRGREENRSLPGNFNFDSKLVISENVLYTVAVTEPAGLRIFHLSADGDVFVPIQGIPAFEEEISVEHIHLSEGRGKREHTKVGAFAVSGQTFYVEYQRRLFRWQSGDSEWQDTGLVDTDEQPVADVKNGFKLAVSGETVYVGKRSGRLLQSLDGGDSWKDITPTLPLFFTAFNEIVFAGSTVYVATDEGVLASRTGMHWRVITDDVVIDRFAVNALTVYGAGDTGVYRLGIHGKWEQVSPDVPGKVLSLVVDRDRLYVATEQRGMFHISLAEEVYSRAIN